MGLKTFIRWPGNKSKYIKQLRAFLPPDIINNNMKGRYIEPFLGSGAMFISLHEIVNGNGGWILGDMNEDLMSCWKLVRDDPQYIISYFKRFQARFAPMTLNEKLHYCQKLTANIPKLPPGSKKRAAIYMLMRFTALFGHILRRGRFVFNTLEVDVYYGKRPLWYFSDKYYALLHKVSEVLRNKKGMLLSGSYKKALKKARTGDFVYLDPPYIEEHDYQFNYNKGERIDTAFVDELVSEVRKLDAKGVRWMMSQADTPTIRNAFKGYDIKTIKVYRIASRDYKTELLIRGRPGLLALAPHAKGC